MFGHLSGESVVVVLCGVFSFCLLFVVLVVFIVVVFSSVVFIVVVFSSVCFVLFVFVFLLFFYMFVCCVVGMTELYLQSALSI